MTEPDFQKKSGSAVLGQKGGQNGFFVIFLKNGSNDFVHILYGVRGGDCLTSCENRMSKKILVLELWPGTFR